MSKAVPLLLAIALGAGVACSTESAGPTRGSSNADDDAGAADTFDAGTADGTHRASAELMRCAIGRKEPTSIPDQITRINALVPADAPCIIASLPRPLSVVATKSRESAQPAGGDDSPRLFFVLPKLVVAAVPSGQGSRVIELGERLQGGTRSVKGELEVPVNAALPSDAAFTRVLNTQGIATSCGTCHGTERTTSTPKAFVSDVIQPRLDQDVSVEQLSAMHDRCVTEADPSDRCAMLHAVFDLGTVRQGSLAPD